MTAWGQIFYHIASPSLAEIPLVPAGTERQVASLIANYCTALRAAYSPIAAVHALVFGEWGHGKSQVLFRVASGLEKDRQRCATLVVVPEDLSPRSILVAAAASAARRGFDGEPLREAAAEIASVDPTAAARPAARALADWAASSGRPHAAILFDEAQTIGGTSFQSLLQELQQSFSERRIVLHTLQCHSLVSLDRARQLAEDLAWLRGPNVRHVHLASLDGPQAHELLRSRIVAAGGHEDAFSEAVAATICRLAGGNPRKVLLLAQEVAMTAERRGATAPTGDDVVTVASVQAGGRAGSRLFETRRLQEIVQLLPQVWPAPLGERMANYLWDNIGQLFGEGAEIPAAELAAELDTDVHRLNNALARPIAGQRLFGARDDPAYGVTVFFLSPGFLAHLATAFAHEGGFDERKAQFDCLLAPGRMQREVADAVRQALAPIAAAPPTPLHLGTESGQPVRAYRVQVKVPDVEYQIEVLVAPVLGTYWRAEALDRLVAECEARRASRAILFDYVVDGDGEGWLEGIGRTVGVLPDIVRVGYDDWSSVIAASAADAEAAETPASSAPAVAAARYCAALLGGMHAGPNGPNLTQHEIISNLRALFKARIPRPALLCYLPSATERALLDLAQWDAGEALTLAALKQAAHGQILSQRVLGSLVPHYLEKDGSRWRRTPPLRTPLAQAIADVLKGASSPLSEDRLRDEISKRLVFVQSAELTTCIDWTLQRLVREGAAERRLDGYVFIDAEAEAKRLRKTIRQSRRELDKVLQQLEALDAATAAQHKARRDRLGVEDAVSAEEPAGHRLVEHLQTLEGELTALKGDVAADIMAAQTSIASLIGDARNEAQRLAGRVREVHAAWRTVAHLDEDLTALETAARVIEESGRQKPSGADALSRAKDAYARFAARRDALESVLSPYHGSDSRRRILGAVLGGGFHRMLVTYTEA